MNTATRTHKLAERHPHAYSTMVTLHCTCGHAASTYTSPRMTHREAVQDAEAKILNHAALANFGYATA